MHSVSNLDLGMGSRLSNTYSGAVSLGHRQWHLHDCFFIHQKQISNTDPWEHKVFRGFDYIMQ